MHRVHDWVAMHGLDNLWPWQRALEDALQARAVLPSGPDRARQTQNNVRSDTGLSADAAWAMSAAAMRAAYPDGEEVIGAAERDCDRDFTPSDDPDAVPYTIPNRKPQRPFVRVHYRGRARDLIATAHEFGHVVQAIACDFRFVPPVVREITAFLSELALLEHLRNAQPALYPGTKAAWLSDNRIYLDQDGRELLGVLRTPNTAYQYRLNYPLARLASTAAHRRLPVTLRWRVFQDDLPLYALVGGPQAIFLESLEPFAAERPSAASSLSHYREMGIATHWSLAQKSDSSRNSLRDFWASFHRKPEPVPDLEPDHSPDTVDFFAALGICLELLATSNYHSRFSLKYYFDVEILPALMRNQIRLYLSPSGRADALVTWAWLSTQIQRKVHATGRALASDEWTCGSRLFFNDGITRNGSLRAVSHDLIHSVFPDHVATALRRNPDTTVKRIYRWSGINLRKAMLYRT